MNILSPQNYFITVHEKDGRVMIGEEFDGEISYIPIDKNNAGVIIEIKKMDNSKIEESLEEALNQIKDKSYFIEMKNEGITECIAISVVFDSMIGKTKYEIISI